MVFTLGKRVRLRPRQAAPPKQEKVETETNNDEVKRGLSYSMDLLTPQWIWHECADSTAVPKKVLANRKKADRAGHTTEGSANKTELSMEENEKDSDDDDITLSGHGRIDHTILELLNIVCDDTPFDVRNLFSIRDWDKDDVLIPRAIDQSLLESKPERVKTFHQYELAFHTKKLDKNKSAALFLTQKLGRRLGASEVLTLSLRNLWNSNLELQVGAKFLYVDHYVFTYFAKNFNCGGISLQFPANLVPMDILATLYNWMLHEKDEFIVDDLYIPIFIAADFLGVQQILEHYWYSLSSSWDVGLWEQTAFEGFMKCRVIGNEQILSTIASRIGKMFNPMAASEEFLQLNAKELSILLKQDTLCVNSEDEVFLAAIRWFESDWPARIKDIPLVVSSIRFPHVSPWLRRSLVQLCENPVIDEVRKGPEINAWLWESVKFCGAMLAGDSSELQCHPVFAKFHRNRCADRYWVFCPGLPHHHSVNCPRFREATYETYKQFLCRLQTHSSHYIANLSYIPNKHWAHYNCCSDLDPSANHMRQCHRPLFYCVELDNN